MAADIAEIRQEVYTRLLLKKTNLDFVNNNFEIQQAIIPWEEVELIAKDYPSGLVSVMGMAPEDAENRSRTNLSLHELGVQVDFRVTGVNPADINTIDEYLELVRQLDDACRQEVDPDSYSWTRREYLKDENGVPFSFMSLRTAGVFEAIFTVWYNHVLEP